MKFIVKRLSWLLIKGLIRLKYPQVRQLSTADLAQWLDSNRNNPLLLDARTEAEYRVSHLQNACLVADDLQDTIALKKANFSTPIVVYCSVGYRSAAIARQLQSLGYQNVLNLSGSIFQWFNENRALYQQGQPTDRVHPYQKFWRFLLT